ncbi:MAG: DUF92 domain-containing protein [Thermoanaerobaculia bacterium]
MTELSGTGAAPPSFTTHETLRKSIHIAFGLLAFTLRWVPWRIAAVIAAGAVVGNWLLLHRLVGKRVARHERGYDAGILLYPLAVTALIVAFNWHLEIAAAAWMILAFGDGFATLAGRRATSSPLPWNAAKSWNGLLAFLVAGAIGSIAINRVFGAPSLLLLLVAVILAGIVETLPLGIDDNLTVPVTASGILAMLAIQPMVVFATAPTIAWPWIVVNTVLAVLGLLLGGVDLSGCVAGWLLGNIVVVGAGPAMYVALLAFFILGTLCTKLGYARKSSAGLAQHGGGRRGASHAFANVGVAAACAVACWRGLGLVPLFMGITALATATCDTVGSEIGQWLGRSTFRPLSFRRVERGTEGAISMEGTLAGIIGAFGVAVAGTSMAVHQLRPGFTGSIVIDKAWVIGVVTASAALGSYLESVVGSAHPEVPNGVRNFLNTAVGALLFWIAWHYVPMFSFEF